VLAAWVERIAQVIAHEVDAQQGQHSQQSTRLGQATPIVHGAMLMCLYVLVAHLHDVMLLSQVGVLLSASNPKKLTYRLGRDRACKVGLLLFGIVILMQRSHHNGSAMRFSSAMSFPS
jgi:hypothetical protein